MTSPHEGDILVEMFLRYSKQISSYQDYQRYAVCDYFEVFSRGYNDLEIQAHKISLANTILRSESWKDEEENVIGIDRRFCYTFKAVDKTVPLSKDTWRYIPPSMGCLNCLIDLNLSDIDLIGEIPASLRNLVNLTSLRLDHNSLTNEIPSDIFVCMSQLRTLNLSYNQLSGGIPDSLVKLTSCITIYLDHNRMIGDLNILSTANLPILIQLNLSCNFFVGKISMNNISHCMPSLNLFDVSDTKVQCRNKGTCMIRFQYY